MSTSPSTDSANDSSSDLEHLVNGSSPKEYRVSRSKLLKLINWSHVLLSHMPTILALGLSLGIVQLFHNIFVGQDHGMTVVKHELSKVFMDALEEPVIFTTGLKITLLMCGVVYYLARADNPVYLIDFATFEPPTRYV